MKNLKWILLVILSLIWGSSFILMKRGLEAYSSEQVAALRIGMAYLFLVPFLVKYYSVNLKKYWVGLLGMGVFGNLIPAFLFTKAETGISSSLAGMLNALTPLFTIIVGVLAFRQRSNIFQLAGILIGLVGAVLLLYFRQEKSGSSGIVFALCVVAATICYAISVNMIRKYLYDLSSTRATVWAFMFTGPVALLYLFSTDFMEVINKHPQAISSLGYTAILGVVGSALSVIAFNELIKISGALFASTTTYLIPVVAVLWGILDGEHIHWMQVVAMCVILGAISLINFSRKTGSSQVSKP
jgi:drug/metabolite transporter (DMT)-like permease